MFTPVSFGGRLFRKYLLGSEHPGKIRMNNLIGRLFYNGITIRSTNDVVFTVDANDWITRIILKEGDYESGSVMLAKKILRHGGVFIDIGANFGLFTCQIGLINEKVKVIAVEPNYRIIERLIRNIRQNSLQNRACVLNVAAGKEFGFVSLQQTAEGNLGSTRTSEYVKGQLAVMCCPLDVICAQSGNPVELLKIDIEGNEFDIFEKFQFENYTIRNIIMEFNQMSKVSFEQLQSFFNSRGFDSYTIKGEKLLDITSHLPENNIWWINRNSV